MYLYGSVVNNELTWQHCFSSNFEEKLSCLVSPVYYRDSAVLSEPLEWLNELSVLGKLDEANSSAQEYVSAFWDRRVRFSDVVGPQIENNNNTKN